MADNTQDEDLYVDDFAEENFDAAPADADDALGDGSDDWSDDEEYTEGGAEDGDELPPKKKSKLFNYIIIVVVLLIGAGVFLMRGGSDNKLPPPPGGQEAADAPPLPSPESAQQGGGDADVAAAGNPTNPTPAPAPATDDGKDGGFMLEPDAKKVVSVVEVGQPNNTVAPVDAPAPPPTPIAPLTDSNPAPTPTPATDAPKSATEFPTVDKILKPQPDTKTADTAPAPVPAPAMVAAPDNTAPVPAPVVATPVTATPTVSSDAIKKMDAYKALADQLADEQAKTADLQKQLDKTANNDSAAQIAALKDQVAALTAKVQAKQDDMSGDTDMAPKKVVHVRKPVASSSDDSMAPRKVVTPKPVLTTKWALKAASPGRALLAQPNGDMKTVHVGDVMEPIGKIVSIDAASGSWKVRGTKGSISQ